LAHLSRAARMVAMCVGAQDVGHSSRIEARLADVRDHVNRAHACTDIDQADLRAAVYKVDVTVVGIGQVEPERARAYEMDALGQLHGSRPGLGAVA
jgi:hypothetical protein